MDPASMGPAGSYPSPPDLLGLVPGVAGQVAGDGASQQLVLHGTAKPSEASDDDSDSEDSDGNGQPPKEIGDVDPSRCKVSGPGFSGAAAGMPVQLYLYAHDAYGRRLRSGGDEVVVRVSPASSSMALAAPIDVTVVDNDNGTYTATYTPPMKGNYFLSVDVNYLPITGSPFPVFFSNPLDPAEAAAAAAAAAGPAPAGGLTPPSGSMDPAVMAMAAAAKQAISGAVAQSDSALRTIHVTNMSASVSMDQYRQLFSIAGKIMDIKQAGEGVNAMLIIEYGTVPEAEEAAKMNGMAVGDRSLVVQNGVVYKATASSLAAIAAPPAASQTPQETLDALQVVVPSVMPTLPMIGMPGLAGMPMPMPGLGMGMGMGLPPTDPLMAMQQLQQMQELQRIQSQMEANKQLAEQVARMRALARTSKGNGRNPDEERLKATDAVMERLNRKLGAMGEAAGGGAGSRRSRSRSSSSSGSSRSRSRGRRDKSRDRRRSRTRSRDRRDRERRERERREQERRDRERKERERREMERRESERRERDRRERDQRERERRDRDRERDRDRRRDSSRDRKRDGSRERRRDGSRDRKRESSRDRKRDSSRDRKAHSKRSRSRTPEQARDSKRDERKREVSEGPAGGQGKEAELEQRKPDADVAEVHPAEGQGKQAETNGHGTGSDPVLPSGEADGKDKDRDESPDREKGSRRRERDERKKDKKERKERRKEKKSRRDKGDRDEDEGDEDKHAASDVEAAAPGDLKADV